MHDQAQLPQMNSPFVRSVSNPIITAGDLPYRAHAAFNPGAARAR